MVSNHALDHLSDGQRKIFKEENLIDTLTKEIPHGIGFQRNGRYATFFKKKEGYLKIILELKSDNRLEIVTYMNTDTMPNLKRMGNTK